MSVRHLFCRCTQNSACTIKVFSKTPGAVQCQINEQKLQLRRISTTLKNSRLAGTFGLKMKVTRNVLRSKAVFLKHLESVIQALTAVTVQSRKTKELPKEEEESWKTLEKKRIGREKALLQKVAIDRMCVLFYRISYLLQVFLDLDPKTPIMEKCSHSP